MLLILNNIHGFSRVVNSGDKKGDILVSIPLRVEQYNDKVVIIVVSGE